MMRSERGRKLTGRSIAVLALGLLAAPLSANIGFDGDWRLDQERTDPPPNGQLVDIDMKLTVEGDDLLVAMEVRSAQGTVPVRFTYIGDNKPHDVPDFRGGTRKARARFNKKGKFLVSYTISRGRFELDAVETWELSKDGSELVIQQQFRIPDRRPQIRRQTYVRPPADG